jgi:hypothetical protein
MIAGNECDDDQHPTDILPGVKGVNFLLKGADLRFISQFLVSQLHVLRLQFGKRPPYHNLFELFQPLIVNGMITITSTPMWSSIRNVFAVFQSITAAAQESPIPIIDYSNWCFQVLFRSKFFL